MGRRCDRSVALPGWLPGSGTAPNGSQARTHNLAVACLSGVGSKKFGPGRRAVPTPTLPPAASRARTFRRAWGQRHGYRTVRCRRTVQGAIAATDRNTALFFRSAPNEIATVNAT
jgi:hypothetical protein